MHLDEALARFDLLRPAPLARTATGTVWTVRESGGGLAILKLIHPEETEELRGASYLQSLDGQGAVRVLQRHGTAILMEHCPGPSSGDLARSGHDDAATGILCDVIRTLLAARPDPTALDPLLARFAPLTDPALEGDVARAAAIARRLLADTVEVAALHGDLHHDNVLHSAPGWLAIDPKGVGGDPAYEPANAFRNPAGLGEHLFDPDRTQTMAARFSHSLGQSPKHLLGWAAAHCALSTRWSLQAGQDIGQDLRLLPILLAAWQARSRT